MSWKLFPALHVFFWRVREWLVLILSMFGNADLIKWVGGWSLLFIFFSRVREGLVLILSMFGNSHKRSNLILAFVCWEVFDCWFNLLTCMFGFSVLLQSWKFVWFLEFIRFLKILACSCVILKNWTIRKVYVAKNYEMYSQICQSKEAWCNSSELFTS